MSFPKPPEISEKLVDECTKTGNYIPILFEWYTYTSAVVMFFASIQKNSSAVQNIPETHYHILIGLLSRCAKLMHSNVALTHEGGLFGETTAIIDRCIFESAIKLSWLCKNDRDEYFNRVIASGLDAEIKLKCFIDGRIKSQGGVATLDQTVLDSIDRLLAESGLSNEDIKSTKPLPYLNQMIESLEYHDIVYVVGQKMSSHHIHGNWASLMFHYLEKNEEGGYRPRDLDVKTHPEQFIYIPIIVLHALLKFISYTMAEKTASDLSDPIIAFIEEIEKFANMSRDARGVQHYIIK